MPRNNKVSRQRIPLSGMENEDSLNALVRAIQYAEEFVLLLAICNSNSLRKDLISRLRTNMAGRKVEELCLDGSEDNLYTTVQSRLSDREGVRPDVFMVYGLETWLPAGTEGENSGFVKNLNIARNDFAQLFRGAMVLWLSDHHLNAIARGAPDFCSVRSGIYLFSAAPEERIEGERILQSLGLDGVAGLPFADRQRRIHEIEEMLEEYHRLPESQRDLQRERRLLDAAAEIYYTNADYDKAEPLMKRALAIDEQSFGKDHPNVAIRLNNLAALYQATNRLAEAEPLMKRVIEIFEKAYGQEHPNVAIRLNNLAALYQATNRLAEAEPLMKRALGIDEQSFGKDHPKVARDLNNLAALYQATNRLAEAEPLMKRALAIDEQSYSKDHPNIGRDLNNLAAIYLATNRLAEAEPLMKRALVIDEQSYGKDHPNIGRDLNNLAAIYLATNRLAEAEPLMKRHLEIFLQFTRQTGHPHPHLNDAINNYGRLLEQMGLSREEVVARLKEMGVKTQDQ